VDSLICALKVNLTFCRKVVVCCPAIGGQNDTRCFPSPFSFSVAGQVGPVQKNIFSTEPEVVNV
jgi:hypothetical protein